MRVKRSLGFLFVQKIMSRINSFNLKEKYAITGRVKSCHYCYYYYYYYYYIITMQLYNFASLKVVSFAAARTGVMQASCP